jgi:hypothetical protein
MALGRRLRASGPEVTTTPAATERADAAPPSPPGTPTSGDAACAEPAACRQDWARAVAEAAGYTITVYTESAWVAQGRGQSFYIWVTEPVDPDGLREEGYRVVRRIDGIPILGDGIRLALPLDQTQPRAVAERLTAPPRAGRRRPRCPGPG